LVNGAFRCWDTGIPESGIVRTSAADDTVRTPAAGVCGAMRIGDPVTYRGKRYVLRGLDPMGIPDRLADIEDAETGELMRVPVSELVFG
jgi:hypothetical protein